MTTLRRQIELESIFLVSIVAAFSLFFVIHRNNPFSFGSNIVSFNSPLATDPKQDVFSQTSSDGTKKVIMKISRNEDDTQTYSFYTSDGEGINEQFIFEKTLDAKGKMTIPFNTWSPNDKYFFIQEDTENGKSVLAFEATGVEFSQEEKFLDVTDLFKKKDTGNMFKEATGWASESLIIINTTGPSYWFEIPTKAIIQLSTGF